MQAQRSMEAHFKKKKKKFGMIRIKRIGQNKTIHTLLPVKL